jgi:hypothetical protein
VSLRALLRRKKDSRLDDKRQTLILDARVYCNMQLKMPFLSPSPPHVGRDVKKTQCEGTSSKNDVSNIE